MRFLCVLKLFDELIENVFYQKAIFSCCCEFARLSWNDSGCPGERMKLNYQVFEFANIGPQLFSDLEGERSSQSMRQQP